MRVLATTLVLAAASGLGAPFAVAEEPGAGAGIDAPAASPAAPAPSSATTTAAPAAAPGPAPLPARTEVAPTQALVDKLGEGDRLFLAGDYRNALFAYQDAVYMQPRYAPARVRLGRAYLALRYPEQALAQAEAALAEDPGSAEARKLLEDARWPPPRPTPGAASAPAAAAAAPTTEAPRPGPRVFKLTPEDAPAAQPAQAAAPVAAPGAEVPATAPGGAAPPVIVAAPGAGPAAAAASSPEGPPASAAEPTASPAPQPQVAAQHYRTALGHLQRRDWAKAVAALSDAILADPGLAVAYSARGSARFALGKYRDAAEDYASAIRLDPKLGTPLYGLAECHRVLGDGKKAAEMYDRYARSTASDVRDDLRATATRRAAELR